MEWIVVKSLASLAGVLGLMFGLALVVKRLFFSDRSKSASAVSIEILGSRNLAPKRTVYVLQVMEKVIVVGMTDQGMQTLAELDGTGAKKKQHLQEQRSAQSTPPSFSDYLGKQLNSFVVNRVRRLKKA